MRWLLLLTACSLGDTYRCAGDDQCVLAGMHGRCEPTGYCSFADLDCSSGRRYGRWAPANLAQECVADSDLAVNESSDFSTTDFSISDSSASDLSCGGDLQPCCNGSCDNGFVCGNGTCFLFYDGFDSLSGWSPKMENGSMLGTDTKAYRGNGSLKITANGGSATWELATLGRAQSQSPLYARAFFWIPSTASLSPSQDTGLMGYTDSQNNPFPLAGLGLTSTFRLSVFVQNWGSFTRALSANAIPLDDWVCLEWQVDYNNAPIVAAQINGVDAAMIHPSPLPNPLNIYTVGFAGRPPASPVTFWIDEIALDTHPIGCAR